MGMPISPRRTFQPGPSLQFGRLNTVQQTSSSRAYDPITQAANEMADVSPDSNVALLTAVAGESNQTLAYDFNILGTPLGVDPSPTPLPGTLPLFAAGLGAMGLFGWRGRRLRLIMSILVA